MEADAWLGYWYAIALKPSDPILAEERLEKSYQQFIIDHDIKGIYSAWIAAVESIAISWDDFSKLEIWMNRFDEIRKQYACSSIELKIRFYATAIYGLSLYNPQHDWLRSLIKICERVFHFFPVKIVKMLLSTYLAHYYTLTCQLTKLHVIAPLLESALENETLPAIPRIINAYLLVIQRLYLAEADKALEFSQKGFELSRKSGIHSFEDMLLANNIACYICNNDLVSARNTLQQAIRISNPKRRFTIAMLHSSTA